MNECQTIKISTLVSAMSFLSTKRLYIPSGGSEFRISEGSTERIQVVKRTTANLTNFCHEDSASDPRDSPQRITLALRITKASSSSRWVAHWATLGSWTSPVCSWSSDKNTVP